MSAVRVQKIIEQVPDQTSPRSAPITLKLRTLPKLLSSFGAFIDSSSHSFDFTFFQGFEEDVTNFFVLESSLFDKSPGTNTLLGFSDHIQHCLCSRFFAFFGATGFGMLAFCTLPFSLVIDDVSFWICLDIFSRSLLILTSSFWIFIQASLSGIYCRLSANCFLWQRAPRLSVFLLYI